MAIERLQKRRERKLHTSLNPLVTSVYREPIYSFKKGEIVVMDRIEEPEVPEGLRFIGHILGNPVYTDAAMPEDVVRLVSAVATGEYSSLLLTGIGFVEAEENVGPDEDRLISAYDDDSVLKIQARLHFDGASIIVTENK